MICTTCGKPTPIERMEKGTITCKACAAAYNTALTRKHNQILVDKFDVWLAKIKSVPRNYPTLTEEQWLEACNFFDGCARCHNKEIDTRGFFVGAKLGGRYCDWNVIPLCERCATRWDLDKSTFKYVKKCDHNAGSKEYRECLEKIIIYLGGKLDAAAGFSGASDGSTGGSK